MRDALALALVHFIWQGALLAIAGALLMRTARVPSVRYAIGIATMLAMLLAPMMTFMAIQSAGKARSHSTTGAAIAVAPTDSSARTVPSSATASRPQSTSATVIVPAAWIFNVWALGVMVLSLRFAGGWTVARRLARQTLTPAGEEIQALAARMAARLNVRISVRVCESASVAVPMMLGCLQPVIILPPAAVIALPPAQLEALLAHELAHIRRHDYLVNLLQTGVETVCFYHPAVWWISREVRRHREHCCDDIAVGACDRLTYVTALSALASISTPQLALSAAGGSLRDRVRRLIEPTTHSASPKGAWIAMLPILLVIAFVAPQAWSTQTTTAAPAAPASIAAAPAVPVSPAVEEVAAEQARPSAQAREAERARAEAERLEAAQSRGAARAREIEREVKNALEASKEVQELTQEAARRQLQRQRELRARIDVAEFEERLRQIELTTSRRRELAEKGLVSRNDVVATEEQLRQMKQHLERARMQQELTSHDLELRRERVRELVERASTEHRNSSLLDSTAALEPQDRLTITIDNEPDLPRMFTVRPDGSIRFPFLGSIRVQGSTTAQVQSAIQKLLADKGLARNPVVNVTASRGR